MFLLIFVSVDNVAPLCLQWTLAQLFFAAWPGGTGQCSIYLSQMSMVKSSYLSLALQKPDIAGIREIGATGRSGKDSKLSVFFEKVISGSNAPRHS
jgi:hypothetical protein